jgi:hypothetical protein
MKPASYKRDCKRYLQLRARLAERLPLASAAAAGGDAEGLGVVEKADQKLVWLASVGCL